MSTPSTREALGPTVTMTSVRRRVRLRLCAVVAGVVASEVVVTFALHAVGLT